MNIGTLIYTWFFGNYVGKDNFDNKYYCNSKDYYDLNSKRWVLFSKEIDPTLIPPHWHAWLHKSIDEPPINYKHKFPWQKDHQRNMTGTLDAYYPKSHPLSKSQINALKKEYEKWNP